MVLGPIPDVRLFRLQDLVAPLPVDRFVDEHWLPGIPHIGHVDASLIGALADIEGLAGPEALLDHRKRPVRVFGPQGERREVPPGEALGWLHRGHTLYFDRLQRTVPAARDLLHGLATEMGFEPWQLALEAFAGVEGAVATRHYDHDVTVQVLLAGEKDWVLERNPSIEAPLESFHPPIGSPVGSDAEGEDPFAAFGEEVYADDPRFEQRVAAAEHRTVRAKAGSSVFVPRGWWHATRSLTDTWSVNLVFHSVTWARALGRALEIRLHADPRFRGSCGELNRPGRARTAAEEAHRSGTIDELRTAAHSALEDITVDEVSLAMLGFIGRRFRWSPSVRRRELSRAGDGWALNIDRDPPRASDTVAVPGGLVEAVEALCRLRSTFRWDHLPPLLAGGDAGELYVLLARLVRIGAVEIVHPGLST